MPGRSSLDAEAELPRLALVLWSAQIGGAETVMLALAQRLRRLGSCAELVILGGDGPLVDRLSTAGLPYHLLGFARGREVLRHPRRFARAVASTGPDGVLLPECGFFGAALRMSGYDLPIVAKHGTIGYDRTSVAKHGTILPPGETRTRQAFHYISRASGAWGDLAEVAVSEHMLARMRQQPHARHLVRIYNGVDPNELAPRDEEREWTNGAGIVVGFVGRLIPGKGVDILIHALAAARDRVSARLLVAGDGPDRNRLSSLARRTGVGENVEFLGMIDNVGGFWDRCDVAIVPSDTWIESFCLAALEAMACGKPVVATRTGALPELVLDGVSGTLVSPGDIAALANAIVSYAQLPSMRREHAAAARRRAVERFHIDDCARAYLQLFASLGR